MAGVASLPGLEDNAGIFGRLARSQYGALAAMRWQMLANGARSVQGAFELGARSVTFMLYAFRGFRLRSRHFKSSST